MAKGSIWRWNRVSASAEDLPNSAGEFHTDVAATLNSLGVLHRMYAQYAKAEPLPTPAMAVKEKLLGLDHTDMALSIGNVAQPHMVQG